MRAFQRKQHLSYLVDEQAIGLSREEHSWQGDQCACHDRGTAENGKAFSLRWSE